MEYDQTSFLAGLAVGRILRIAQDIIGGAAWIADAQWLLSSKKLLAQTTMRTLVGGGVTLEDSGLAMTMGSYTDLYGNVVDMLAGDRDHSFAIDASNFVIGDHIYAAFDVDEVYRRLYCRSAYTEPQYQRFVGLTPGPPGASAYAPTSAIWELVKDDSSHNLHFSPLSSGGAIGTQYHASITWTSLQVQKSIWKAKPGLCAAAILHYIDANGDYVYAPVMISDVAESAEISYLPDGSPQVDNPVSKTTHTFDGLTFYMYLSTSYDNPDTDYDGVPTLDLTGEGALTTDVAIFAAVAAGINLRVLRT